MICVAGEMRLFAQNFLHGTVTYPVLHLVILRKLCNFFKFIFFQLYRAS